MAALGRLLGYFGFTLREVNIDSDPVLQERYGFDIPVVFIGTHKAAKHRIDVTQFRKQLQEVRSRCNGKGIAANRRRY